MSMNVGGAGGDGGVGSRVPLPPPVPPPPSRVPPAAAPPPSPWVGAAGSPPPRRRVPRWSIAVGGVAILLVGALIGYVIAPSAGLRLPRAISGVPRITGGSSAELTAAMVAAAGMRGSANVAGVYGTGGRPRFVFFATASGGPVSADTATMALLAPYVEDALGRTFSVDLDQVTTVRRDDVTYQCIPLQGPSIDGSVCAWNAPSSTGTVFSLQGAGSPVRLTEAVRAAVG